MLRDILPILIKIKENQTQGQSIEQEKTALNLILKKADPNIASQANAYINKMITSDFEMKEEKYPTDPYAKYYSPKEYAEILNFTRLAALFENTGDPVEQARKLAIFKGDISNALQYLQSYNNKYEGYPKGMTVNPMSACDFKLPPATGALRTWTRIANAEQKKSGELLLLNPKFQRMLTYTDGLESTLREINDNPEMYKLDIINRHIPFDSKNTFSLERNPKAKVDYTKYNQENNHCSQFKTALIKGENIDTSLKSYIRALNERDTVLKRLLNSKHVDGPNKMALLQELRNQYLDANNAYHYYKSREDLNEHENAVLAAIEKERSLLLPLLFQQTKAIIAKKAKPHQEKLDQYESQQTHRAVISKDEYYAAFEEREKLQADINILDSQPKLFESCTYDDLRLYEQVFLAQRPELSLQAFLKSNGMPNNSLDKFDALSPLMKRAGTNVPDLFIDGNNTFVPDAKMGFTPCTGYYARTLDMNNPEDAKLAAVLGKKSGCCQSLSHEYAETQTVLGLTGKNCKFFVVFQGDPNNHKPTDRVVAQSFVYVDKHKRIAFDSPEAEPPTVGDIPMFSLDKSEANIVRKMFKKAAMLFTKHPNIDEARIGFSHTSSHTGLFPADLGIKSLNSESDPAMQPIDPTPKLYSNSKLNSLDWEGHIHFDSQIPGSGPPMMSRSNYAYPLGDPIAKLSPQELKEYDQSILAEFQSNKPIDQLEMLTNTVNIALKLEYTDVIEHIISIAPDKERVNKYINQTREKLESKKEDTPDSPLFPQPALTSDTTTLGPPTFLRMPAFRAPRPPTLRPLTRDTTALRPPTLTRDTTTLGPPTLTRETTTLEPPTFDWREDEKENTSEENLSPTRPPEREEPTTLGHEDYNWGGGGMGFLNDFTRGNETNPFEQKEQPFTSLEEPTTPPFSTSGMFAFTEETDEKALANLNQAMQQLGQPWYKSETGYACRFETKEKAENIATQLKLLDPQQSSSIEVIAKESNFEVILRGFTTKQLNEFVEKNKPELEKIKMNIQGPSING